MNFKEAPGELTRRESACFYLNRQYTNGKSAFICIEELSQGKDKIQVLEEFKDKKPTGWYVQILRSELLRKINERSLTEI